MARSGTSAKGYMQWTSDESTDGVITVGITFVGFEEVVRLSTQKHTIDFFS